MGKQGLISQHRNVYSISCNKSQWKRNNKIVYLVKKKKKKRDLTELPSPSTMLKEFCDSQEGPSPKNIPALLSWEFQSPEL